MSNISEPAAGIITFLGALILAYVLIVATHEVQGEATQAPSVYETNPSPYDAHLTALDREALDKAYLAYRMQLFEGWLKDPTKQPERALFGAEKARTIYIRVLKAIDERKVQ